MAEVTISYADILPSRRLWKKGFKANLVGGNHEVIFVTPTLYDDKRDAIAAAKAATNVVHDKTKKT
jgi:uncharacterized protein YegP (UPF0339 family)